MVSEYRYFMNAFGFYSIPSLFLYREKKKKKDSNNLSFEIKIAIDSRPLMLKLCIYSPFIV